MTDTTTGEATIVRELWVPGTGLTGRWCGPGLAARDAPSTEVHWSDLRLTAESGTLHPGRRT